MTGDTTGILCDGPEADHIRAAERRRLRALVEANVDIARPLHADDFQLVTPSGVAFSKEEYLGHIASGYLDYRLWEPDAIAVRVQGQLATIRYQARLAIVVGGQTAPLQRTWHTDSYERRDGRWQVVWSQATTITAVVTGSAHGPDVSGPRRAQATDGIPGMLTAVGRPSAPTVLSPCRPC